MFEFVLVHRITFICSHRRMPKKKKKHAGGRPKGGKPLHEDCCSVKERSPEDSCSPCKNYASYRASKCRYVLGQRKDRDKEGEGCSVSRAVPFPQVTGIVPGSQAVSAR